MPRLTKQKKVLLEETKKFSSFFDAYDLHESITKKNPSVGLATVYRFLNVLESEGSIHAFTCENRKIYSTNKTNHAHFKCEKCGVLKHINIKNADFLKESKDEVCHFQLELVGVCSRCNKTQSAQ